MAESGDDGEVDDEEDEEEEDADIEDGEEEEEEEDEDEEEGEGALLDVERKAQKLDAARCAAPQCTPSQQSLRWAHSARDVLEK